MHRRIATLILLTLTLPMLLLPPAALAKRAAPARITPIIDHGVRYTAPNDQHTRAYVQAWNAKTNQMLWEITLFRTIIIPGIEEDYQTVFIARMSLEEGRLIVVAEDGRVFGVDVKTRAVKKLKNVPPPHQA